jgi:3-deoxy-manno-octulosonate cytidylyltransferase (CMP-KDO synthetase)
MKSVIVIPARMASTRFPGKPLVPLCGKPMIQWVYERAVASGACDDVYITSPDDDILSVASGFGAKVHQSRLDHPTGTDRIAEFAETVAADFYVNVQGDEPLIDLGTIRSVASAFEEQGTKMVSAYSLLKEEEKPNPAAVKVVTAVDGNALYFSRFPIPFPRNQTQVLYKKHIGIYGYTREVLGIYPTWKQGELELSESLEQLRFLENGVSIRMVEGKESAVAVDTPEQAKEVEAILQQMPSQR